MRLRSFGPPVLERENADGSWSVIQRTGKSLALLIFLAARGGRRVSREELSDLLWGDESPERARATLRQALYTVRGLVGEDVLDATRDEVALVAGRVMVDRDAFLAAARDGDAEAMLLQYQGPFCETLDVGGATAFERWAAAEGEQLRGRLLETVAARVTQLIAEGETKQAVALARQLARAEPGHERAVVLLFDALAVAGELTEARERLDELTVRLRAQDRPLPPDLEQRVTRLQRLVAAQDAPPPAPGTLAALGHTLVGRDAVLDALIREAERARKEARPRRIVLAGPAGVGKSRVLDELHARMRLRGARVVRVRFLPGMQHVPYSAFADTIRALAALPAASGVSERTAQTLVGLVPELAARYPGARGATLPEDGRALALRDAGADLFASVAEQRLVVHLIDDFHYADEESLALFMAVRLETERRSGDTLRLLSVRSMRRVQATAIQSTDGVIDVGPLAAADVRRMMADVVPLPEAPWCDALVGRLHELSRGMPQLVMQIVRAAAAAGQLSVTSGTWQTDDPARLLAALDRFAGLEPSLGGLDTTARRVLSILATWARPLDEQDLAALCAGAMPPMGDAAWRDALRTMEERGLVQSRETAWVIAHDSVLEAFLRDQRNARHALAEDDFGLLLAHFGEPRRLSVAVLEHLALLAGADREPSRARALVRRAVGVPALVEAGVTGRRLARRVANAAGHPQWERMLYRAQGFFARQSGRTRIAITVAATLALIALGALLALLQPRLDVEVAPMAENAHLPFAPEEVVVQPRVRVVNGFGRPLATEGRVRVRATQGLLVGDTVVALDSGRAQFRRLMYAAPDSMRDPGHVELSFSGPWYVRATAARLQGVAPKERRDGLVVRELVVNGQTAGPDHIVGVGPGVDSLRIALTVEYTTNLATANYVVGASPTWMPRERVLRLAGLPRPVTAAWRTMSFGLPVPRDTGDHHIVVMIGAEDTVEHLFSHSNWRSGLPRWHDGDDVMDCGPAVFERLRIEGRVRCPDAPSGQQLLGTAILVRVGAGS